MVVVPAWTRSSWDEVARLAELERRLDGPKVVGIGEIGLDGKVTGVDLDLQVRVLRPQLELAAERDLPVMLHCRGEHDLLARVLSEVGRRVRPVRGVMHAFSRSVDLARRFLDLGLSISFAGTITRPRARARKTAAALPLDAILIETDAPSIALEGIPPEKVEPAHTRDVAETLAMLRSEPLEEVARRTTDNARRLFDIP